MTRLARSFCVVGSAAIGAACVSVGAFSIASAGVGSSASDPDRPIVSGAERCPVFPKNNHWNLDISRLPVDVKSRTHIRSIGADDGLHPDFGSGEWNGGPIGIPYDVVGPKVKRKRVKFYYADESDRGPYPIPRNPHIEGGPRSDGDRHILIVDRHRCKLFELYDARKKGSRWTAGSGAIFNLRSNALRPEGWTSADAAGLPILPGLARYEEAVRGAIPHALRFTAPETRREFIYPARHFASSSDDPDLPPMGLRVRLKASFDTSDFPPQARIVLEALKRYGMILADNGASWYVSGAPHEGWDDDDLHSLDRVRGSDLEVVDTSSLPRP